MPHLHANRTAPVLFGGNCPITSPVAGMACGKSLAVAFRGQALLFLLFLVFTSLTSAGESSVPPDKDAPAQTEEHAFEIVDIEWDDFSFKIPVPPGETYEVFKGKDVEGGDVLNVIIRYENHGYLALFLSTRSLRKDYGEFYHNIKRELLLSNKIDGIKHTITMTLFAQTIVPKEYKRIKKVCDLDNALIYQAEVTCNFKQYTKNILVSIGIMKHQSHSYYFLSTNSNADDPREWNSFITWNKRLAELQ